MRRRIDTRRRVSANAPAPRDAGGGPLLRSVLAAVSRTFPDITKPVRKNLAALVVSFLQVIGAARSGHGRLSLATLYRTLPTDGDAHAREKRLHRFLDNWRLDARGVTGGLARMIFGRRGKGYWPILFDQTKSGSSQALFAGVPFEGRTLPLAAYTFEYPWKETACLSQNDIEETFITDVELALPKGVRPVWIGDRGYARASLFEQSGTDGRLYVIRGRGDVCVELGDLRCKLNELRPGVGRAVRYRNVLYQSHARVRVDVVAFHDPSFQEPWWLIIPSGAEDELPTDVVVALYRERMRVEHSFRDFKTHMGLRGLRLKVRITDRMGRLLLAFCVAYCFALVLGASTDAEAARGDLEIKRRKPRHGTTRTISVMFLAMIMLSHPRWRNRAHARLRRIAARVAANKRILSRAPPRITERIAEAA